MKLQDNQEILISIEIAINQKDIDFLFNGWNEVNQPTLQQVIDKAVEHLNNNRAVKVAETTTKRKLAPIVLTDGEPDIEASILAVR